MKYMGNKRKIADELLNVMNVTKNDVFVDLFCGSLSVSQRANAKTIIANDKNKYLIAMWNDLLEGREFPKIISRDLYQNVRDYYRELERYRKVSGEFDNGFIGWVGFMASFNGKFFDGGYSGYNVKGRDYISENIANTISQLNELKEKEGGVVLSSMDYSEVDIPENAIVYCDIPYKKTTTYSTSKFFDYFRFYNWAKRQKHCRLFISEYSMPESDFLCVWQKEFTNAMATNKTYRPIEKLFVVKN